MASQGTAVAMSGDGYLLAIGGPDDSEATGATWVFERAPGGAWRQVLDKLVGAGGVGEQRQGKCVAMAGDGATLAVGGPGDSDMSGAAWVFVRSAGGGWTQQGNKLVGTGGVGQSNQGASVALSEDGATLAVGGPLDTYTGAAWVFARSLEGEWKQMGDKLVGTGGVGLSGSGAAVALSADGSILAVGGPDDNYSVGATWLFTRSGNDWTQQGGKLVGSGVDSNIAEQGRAVALSADGAILAVGSNGDGFGVGGTWIFTQSSGEWTQQGEKLVGTGGAEQQGQSVALSAGGSLLAVGGSDTTALPGGKNSAGVWVFERSAAGEWSQQGNVLAGSLTGSSHAFPGSSVSHAVALSASGTTLAAGFFHADTPYSFGGAWVFESGVAFLAPQHTGVAAYPGCWNARVSKIVCAPYLCMRGAGIPWPVVPNDRIVFQRSENFWVPQI